MGDKEESPTGLPVDAEQLVLQVEAGDGVDGAKGLIQQHDPRFRRQGAGKTDPLLLSA